MEESLAKIRPHTSSSLPNQKTPANLLTAIESTFKEQDTEVTPTAYFAALLTTLDRTIQEKDVSLDEGAILPAELYLLALVAPFVSSSVIRTNLTTLLSLTAPLFPALNHHAPPLRSQLSLYQTIFRSLDKSQLEVQGVRQTFASTLQLCVDPRPKVRKKAVDLVKDLLSNPPTPLIRHPYSERVAEWIKNALIEASAMPFKKGKSAKHSTIPGAEEAIHLLAFLKQIIPNLPPQHLATITHILLTLPRLGNTYLSQTAYSILAEVCAISADDDSTDIGAQIPEVLKIVLSSPPPKTDHLLSSSWVLLLSHAMLAFHACNQESASLEVGPVWKAIWTFLDSTDAKSRKASAESLSRVSSCFSPSLISAAIQDQHNSSVIRKIILQVTEALDALPYARAMPELLSIVSSVIKNLHYRPDGKAPAAEILLMPLIIHIADLRISKGFEYKEAADGTLSVGIQVLGPEMILHAMPLNVEPESRNAGAEPRTFLLPLIAQHHPSSLSHFVSYFVPLSENMFDWQQKAESEGRQSEAKVWNVLIGQVWACLPGYCYCSPRLSESLSSVFSQLLSQLLYGQLQLRPSILKALKVLVDSNVATSLSTNVASPYCPITPQEAHENVEFLQTQAESWLVVLLNVYGTVGRESRLVVGDVIQSWMSIAGEQGASNVFQKVLQIFKSTPQNQSDAFVETTTAQDIFILLLPNLSDSDSKELFATSLVPDILACKDNGVQKRGYKILAKLVESGKIVINANSVLAKVDKMTDDLNPAAKKDRFSLLAALVSRLDLDSLHVIPSLVPEAVLGTKEPSEKTRKVAFDLIITMGKKMCGGGVIKRSMVDGMQEDGIEDADANIEEFMTMVAGGLAGASPHMISATITAISRLVFEFKDGISPNMHTEILTTMLILISSANREIVKSVLGFVKLVIHTLPVELLRPHLKALVPALLNRSHDHKNHFKVKVRHIFERMMRRFNWEEIYACVGEEEEAAKVLINIKKRKDRAKRKKASRTEEGSDSEILPGRGIAGDAFEDVLYGSEDESEGSENEESHASAIKDKSIKEGARLRLDDDDPMDLLGVAVKVTNLNSNRRKQPGQDAARFKIDEGSGKMIIDESSVVDDDDAAPMTNIGGTAYREAVTSVDGFTRGHNGRIKFNKNTKKRRMEEDVMDVDACEMSSEKVKKTKSKDEPKFGHEFKAKRAGGDVKSGNVDPYAYMPLAQAAKARRKGRSQIGIMGKR